MEDTGMKITSKDELGRCDECGTYHIPTASVGADSYETCTYEICLACLQTMVAHLQMRNHAERKNANLQWLSDEDAMNAALKWSLIIKNSDWAKNFTTLSGFLENCECHMARGHVTNSAVPKVRMDELTEALSTLNYAWQKAGRPETNWPHAQPEAP
jgi:hypothetical protein